MSVCVWGGIALLGTASMHGALWVVTSRGWLGMVFGLLKGDVTYRVYSSFQGCHRKAGIPMSR